MTRVFVTGGSGVIGGAIIARLRAQGAEVVASGRSVASRDAVGARGAEPVEADLLDETALAEAMRGCVVAYHVAGVNTLCPTDTRTMERVNGDSPAVVVRAAAKAGVRRVVHTSSAAAIGEEHGTVGREDSPHRGWFLSLYERTKHAGERAALATGREVGVEVVSVNPSSVQGQGRAGGTGKILLALIDGRLKLFIDTRISVVDIDDCVEAHLLAAERGAPGERYLISGATLTSDEALATLERVTGLRSRPRIVPGPIAMTAATVAEGGFRLARRRAPLCRSMMRTMLHGHQYDGTRATRELGLSYTPVEDTLSRLIDWAVAEGHLQDPGGAY